MYDVDAHDRRAPDPLGVLSHYSHVVWYTGDDYVPREPDAPGGSGITKRAVETQNAVRDFINDGGKLFYTGTNAGRVFAEGYAYNPFQDEEGTYCQNGNPTCIIVQDDFLQYWLGAYRYVGRRAARIPADDSIFPVEGTDRPVRPAQPDVQRAGLRPERRPRLDAAGDVVGARPGGVPAVGRLGGGGGVDPPVRLAVRSA